MTKQYGKTIRRRSEAERREAQAAYSAHLQGQADARAIVEASTPRTKNATVGIGNTVHIGVVEADGNMRTVRCGAQFTRSQFSRNAPVTGTKSEVTCKRCLKK